MRVQYFLWTEFCNLAGIVYINSKTPLILEVFDNNHHNRAGHYTGMAARGWLGLLSLLWVSKAEQRIMFLAIHLSTKDMWRKSHKEQR